MSDKNHLTDGLGPTLKVSKRRYFGSGIQMIPGLKETRFLRMVVVVVVYSAILTFSLWLAYQLRFDFAVPAEETKWLKSELPWIVALKLASLLLIGQFAGLLSYFSIPELRRLFSGLLLASGIVLGLWYYEPGWNLPPRSVILADFVLGFVGLAASRLGFRITRERYLAPHSRPQWQARRVGIIGAGDAGATLARELLTKRGLGLQPVAFFDDNRDKWRSSVHNVPVVGSPDLLPSFRTKLRLDDIVIAMPSAPAKRIREIVRIIQKSRLKFTTVPSLDQLATGRVVSQLREVAIEDLLGREPVELEKKNIRGYLEHRVVMVTGAGGSIGQELCRQIAEFDPLQILLVEQCEVQLFQIEQELIELGHGKITQALVADILDLGRMQRIFSQYCPSVVFHAAAHKHVPMMEGQPCEAIQNNTLGTARLAELSSEHRLDRFVMISTDKAINPTNVMGATKRLAELFVQSLQNSDSNCTKFMAVRFGNVLGSSGSVIPTFKRQIAAGGPVTVTHPDVTRFFMTIPEAVSLVLQSGAQGSGGEIFILDMGQPIKVADLARQLIELSGLRPEEDIEIQYVGLRPGEKLYEELRHRGENLAPTQHPKILRLVSEALPLNRIRAHLKDLELCLHTAPANRLKTLLRQEIPEYQPYLILSEEDYERGSTAISPPRLAPLVERSRFQSMPKNTALLLSALSACFAASICWSACAQISGAGSKTPVTPVPADGANREEVLRRILERAAAAQRSSASPAGGNKRSDGATATTNGPALRLQTILRADPGNGPAATNSILEAPKPPALDPNKAPSDAAGRRLMQGDVIEIKVYQEEELNARARVEADGTVTMPLLGTLKVGGKSVEQARRFVHDLLAEDYLVNPQVILSVLEFAKRRFSVMGQVKQPGYYTFPENEKLNLIQAISMAGGYTSVAKPSRVFIKRMIKGREMVLLADAQAMARNRDHPIMEVEAEDTIIVGESFF